MRYGERSYAVFPSQYRDSRGCYIQPLPGYYNKRGVYVLSAEEFTNKMIGQGIVSGSSAVRSILSACQRSAANPISTPTPP
jgi:hypothetical protein